MEVYDELYSIMIDKYNDCLNIGISQEEAYKRSTEMMVDYKNAIREVETGSSLRVLKKVMLNMSFFSSIYFVALTFIYFLVSLVILKSFSKTWLIAVGGAFLYITYFSINLYRYARLFNFKRLSRVGVLLIYLSLIPLLYVLPSLYSSIVNSKNIWGSSWLIIIIILFLYSITDYIINRKYMSIIEMDVLTFSAGFLLTTFLYLFISIKFNIWSIAWIIYVIYLALASITFYIARNKKVN